MESSEQKHERNVYEEKIARGYARKSAVVEPQIVCPSVAEIDQKTLDEGPDSKEGEITEQLSDATDEDENRYNYSTSYTIYKRIQPLIRDPRVRGLALLNFLIALLCCGILITTMIYLGRIFLINRMIAKVMHREIPCLYQWSDWGECSATCMSTSDFPSRSRHVLPKTIVRARGRFPACPENLATMVEQMPCNVYRCPVNLTSFDTWTQCLPKDPSLGTKGGCYTMRDIPTTNQLIYIDTTEIIKDCECVNNTI